jgi:hypothetical protein
MSATQYKPESTRSSKPEDQSSMLRLSAAARAIGLGIAITDAEASASRPGLCSRCFAILNPHRSYTEYPDVFCSNECEQEFIHDALASLTIADCIRIQGRLEALLHSNDRK